MRAAEMPFEFPWTDGADRPGFVEDVQAMRRRVESTLKADEADREVKLGRGGLRDIEFSVQLLQLVHGRTDETVRSGTTLVALDQLAAGGYVGREDARHLAEVATLAELGFPGLRASQWVAAFAPSGVAPAPSYSV